MPKSVFISTGESSGEFYGSLLARQILKRWPDAVIYGIGGERMESAGVRLISRPAHAFGLFELFSAIKNIRASYKKAVKHVEELRPDLVVLIDYPDFNMRLGKIAKRLGIKVLYYVSPQVWAWRKKRRFKIAEISDLIAVILPFEECIYKEIGARVEFVGHPVMEEIESLEGVMKYYRISESEIKKRLGIVSEDPVITLLPGSRPSELKRLIPVIQEVVKRLSEDQLNFNFLLPVAPNISQQFFREFRELRNLGVKVVPPLLPVLNGSNNIFSSSILALGVSRLAIAASGTVVLQAGLMGVPTIVIYRLSKLTYLTGRLVVNVKYISIPNIILDREAFPELLQERANPDMIIQSVRMLMDQEVSSHIRHELLRLRGLFSGKRPSERVVELIGELARW